MAEQKKKFALDIFSILDRINHGELNLWQNLTEEERKGFSPYIITRWLSGTTDPMQLIMVNELVNSQLFQLGNHPELLSKLMVCCGNGKRQRFQWIPDSKSSNKSSSLIIKVIADYYECTNREAKFILADLDNEAVYQLAEDLNWESADLKKLKKELK